MEIYVSVLEAIITGNYVIYLLDLAQIEDAFWKLFESHVFDCK